MSMRALLLTVTFLGPISPAEGADDRTFADIEELYALTVKRVVQEHRRDDRHLAITFADLERRDGAANDKRLWERLKNRLTTKGLVPESCLVPCDEVRFQEENARFVHKSTDRIVWVHHITGFRWAGSDRVAVSREVFRDTLDNDFGPSSLVFSHRAGTWRLVDEQGSEKDDRGRQAIAAEDRSHLINELESIYLTAFASFVRRNDSTHRVYSILLPGNDNGDRPQAAESFATRLQGRLGSRIRSGFVPAEQVAWHEQEMRYYHTPSGKDAWIYSIGPIQWHGDRRLRVPIMVSHAVLAAGGETLVFAKSGDIWVIVDRSDQWVS